MQALDFSRSYNRIGRKSVRATDENKKYLQDPIIPVNPATFTTPLTMPVSLAFCRFNLVLGIMKGDHS